MKRVISIILTAFITFTMPILYSCGDNSDTDTDIRLYKSTEITLPDGISYTWSSLSYSNGSLSLSGYTNPDFEHPEVEQKYVVYNLDNTSGEFVPSDNSYDSETVAVFALTSGTAEVKVAQNDNVYDSMTIIHKDADGNIISEYDCEELFGINLDRFPTNSLLGSFTIKLIAEQDGELYIVSNTGVVRTGDRSRIDSDNAILESQLSDGNLVVRTTNEVLVADFTSGSFISPEIELEHGARPLLLPGYILGSLQNGIVSGWREIDGQIVSETVCNLYDSSVSGGVNAIAAASQDELFVAVYDSFNERDRLWRLNLLSDEEIAQIDFLTVGIIGNPDIHTGHAIAEFNRTNSDTKLRIISYPPLPDAEGNVYTDSALNAFELDLVAGKVPDIMIIDANTGAKLSDYANDQLFLDLYSHPELFGISRDNLLSGITHLELYEGKSDKPSLYYLPLEVRISMFSGRSSEFPEKLTLEGFLDRLDTLDDNQCLVDYMRFAFALQCSLEEFIDFGSGKTSFDSQLFSRFAEAYRNYGDLYRNKTRYNDTDTKWKALANRELLLTNFSLSANQLAIIFARYQLDDFTSVGYPDRDGSGILLAPSYYIGISSKCENLDAAYRFLSLRLSDNYIQNNPNSIPYLTHDTLDTYFENLPRWYYFSPTSDNYSLFSERQNKDTIGYMFPDGFVEYYLSDEICEIMRDIIDSAEPLNDMNDDILSIIMEELDIFANRPEMSASEVAKIIDNRVGTYYNENKNS